MLYIAVTRFNATTFAENYSFNVGMNNGSWAYNTPVTLKQKYDNDSTFVLLEMNNTTNKIMGMSIINHLYATHKYRMYGDDNYNRFCYFGKFRIDCAQFDETENAEIISHLENICFKGKRHLKRGQGIHVLSNKNVNTYLCEQEDVNLLVPIQHMFLKRFGKVEVITRPKKQ